MTTDQPLGSPFIADPADDTPTAITFPAGTPRVFTVEDVLSNATLPERVATVCIRPDLQATYDEAMAELSTLIDGSGKLLEADDDASLADTKATRAQELADTIAQVRAEMSGFLWSVRFRGMSSEDYSIFNKRHTPKGDNPDTTDYNLRLIAATAIEPTITLEKAQQLNAKLGSRIMAELVNTAWNTCNEGGISVPKSLSFSVSPARS